MVVVVLLGPVPSLSSYRAPTAMRFPLTETESPNWSPAPALLARR
jgi:hypothetical protein